MVFAFSNFCLLEIFSMKVLLIEVDEFIDLVVFSIIILLIFSSNISLFDSIFDICL